MDDFYSAKVWPAPADTTTSQATARKAAPSRRDYEKDPLGVLEAAGVLFYEDQPGAPKTPRPAAAPGSVGYFADALYK